MGLVLSVLVGLFYVLCFCRKFIDLNKDFNIQTGHPPKNKQTKKKKPKETNSNVKFI